MYDWRRFSELFKGYEHGYGTYVIQGQEPSGKIKGKALTYRNSTPDEAWLNHLNGKIGLGQIPIRDDNNCFFGVIDIDVKNIDIFHLERLTRIKKFPLVVCRSKSAGAHCYIFFKEPVPAKDLIAKLNQWSSKLGYGGCEIFPKQYYRANKTDDIGNWINLPYFNVDMCQRTCVYMEKDLSFDEFLSYAESMKQDPKCLYEEDALIINSEIDSTVKDIFKIGQNYCPPCLELLLANGKVEEGNRNNTLTHSMVFLKKARPETWKTDAMKLNVLMFEDALPHDEVSDTMRSVDKKGYEYLCKLDPMKSHCDKENCKKARFGVGESGTGERSISFEGIVKYISPSNVYWRVNIMLDGKMYHLIVDTEVLQNQTKFAKHVLEAATRYPPAVPNMRWSSMVDEALTNKIEKVYIPEEASVEGEFWGLFDTFLTGSVQAKNKDELLSSKPWNDGEGTIWFRIGDIKDYLIRKRFNVISQEWLWMQLRKWYSDNDLKEEDMRKQFNIKGKIVRVWGVPTKFFKQVEKDALDTVDIQVEDF